MSILPLEILSVVDRGVPNKERFMLKTAQPIHTERYYVGLGIAFEDGSASPINDNLFWLGRGFLSPADLLIVYTGRGFPNSHEMPNQDGKIFTLFWGKRNVVFMSDEVVPYLFEMGPSQVALKPTRKLQTLDDFEQSNN